MLDPVAHDDALAAVSERNLDSLFFRALPAGWEEDRARFAEAQHERMLEAMARAVAAKGYAKVTVADVVRLAAVSRSTFYEHFADKEQCFLDTYATGSRALIEEIAAAVRDSGHTDWHHRVRTGMERYTGLLAASPSFARALLVDVLGAGPRAVQLRRQVMAGFVQLYLASTDGTRTAGAAMRRVPEPFLLALVGGISELVQEHILARGAETLEELTPTLVEIAFSLVELGERLSAVPTE